MGEIKKLFISLSATVILLFVGLIYQRKSIHSFETAIRIFSFNTIGVYPTLAFLFVISVVLPIIAMIILFRQIYETPELRKKFFSKVILKHVFFGYILMCTILMVDIIYDGTFAAANPASDPSSDDPQASIYNEWHKYIIHVVITPVLFLDAVYSIEIEKIKASEEKSEEDKSASEKTEKKCSTLYYYAAQVFFSIYLAYIFSVILFIYKKHKTLLGSLNSYDDGLQTASDIINHIQYLVTDIVICIFAALIMGLVDQNVSLKRIVMVFKLHTGWAITKTKNNLLPVR